MTESEDDEAFLKRAKQTAKDVVKNQTLEVDTVSGATYSSRGILAAIEKALKEAERVTEEKKNPTPTPTVTPVSYTHLDVYKRQYQFYEALHRGRTAKEEA